MAFQKSSSTEVFLTSMAVEFSYESELPYDELEDTWQEFNYGRPDNATIVPDAIKAYASQAATGSPFPAVILRKSPRGMEVLDGLQRLHANASLGHTNCAGYVVKCNDKVALKIRRAANIRINGLAPVNVEWAVSECVRDFMIDGDESAADVAELLGCHKSRVEKEYDRQMVQNRIKTACVAEGLEPPKFSATIYDLIAQVSEPSDFSAGVRKPVCSALCDIADANYKNGDSKMLLEDFFSIKRIGSKNRTTQFNTQRRKLRSNPSFQEKLNGKGKVEPWENIENAIKTLQRRVKNYRKQRHATFSNATQVADWDDRLAEACRYMRELCTNDVRRKVEPFNYG